MTTTRAGVVSGLALALSVLLAGCGDGFAGEAADEIAATAKTDMQGLDSVHYRGEVTGDSGPVELDIRVTGAGDCTGTVNLGAGSTELLVKDGDSWIRPDEAFWRGEAPDQGGRDHRRCGRPVGGHRGRPVHGPVRPRAVP